MIVNDLRGNGNHLGKGEVDSSILSGSTIKNAWTSLVIAPWPAIGEQPATRHPPQPSNRLQRLARFWRQVEALFSGDL